MSDADAPKVRLFPPLVYLAGLVAGHLVNWWLPIDVLAAQPSWILGGILFLAGLGLIGSAMVNFQQSGTTIRPDRASTSLVIAYLGLAIADRSLSSLILLSIVLLVIRRAVIAHEEAFLERRFGVAYADYKTKVSRWL